MSSSVSLHCFVYKGRSVNPRDLPASTALQSGGDSNASMCPPFSVGRGDVNSSLPTCVASILLNEPPSS